MSGLSDSEIAEAAAEAGISPNELRRALAEKEGSLPARIAQQSTILAPNSRGSSHGHAETRVSAAPPVAVRHIKKELERVSGLEGHMQGEEEADIVNSREGIVYRMRAEADGGGGSLVRVDVDASQAKARQTVMTLTIGVLTTVGVLSALLVTSSTTTLLLAGVAAALAIPLIFRTRAQTKKALLQAQETAQRAMLEAETREVRTSDRPY